MAKPTAAVAMSDKPYVRAIERSSGWDDYDIKNALTTLADADKIRKNKPLMAAIRKEAAAQLKTAQATASQLQGGNK